MPLPADLLRRPIAHRALHDRSAGRPENSPAAIRAAVEAGYAIEIDVQGTSDGQAVVFHDEWMERLTEATGFVKDYTAAELGRITLRHSTDTIPTLPQVLAIVAGRVPLLIEIKDQTDRMAETDGRLEVAVARDASFCPSRRQCSLRCWWSVPRRLAPPRCPLAAAPRWSPAAS